MTGNLVGIEFKGNGGGLTSDYGTVTAGGVNGSANSTGGNDLYGYTGAGGSFAVEARDGGLAGSGTTIPAEFNSFGATNPATVVSPDVNTTIDVSHPSTSVTVSATAASTVFAVGSQTVTLHATVKDPQNATDVVSEGTVTFTLKDSGNNIIAGPVTGQVGNWPGCRRSHYPVGRPGYGRRLGSIFVTYSDGSGNFTDGSNVRNTLTIQ